MPKNEPTGARSGLWFPVCGRPGILPGSRVLDALALPAANHRGQPEADQHGQREPCDDDQQDLCPERHAAVFPIPEVIRVRPARSERVSRIYAERSRLDDSGATL